MLPTHLYMPDDLLDVFRLVLFVISAYSASVLVMRIRRNGQDWNVKTKDSWYSLFMWTLGGCAITLQGIALDRGFTPATVFVSAAILATGKAVHQKGEWGGRAE